MNNILSVENISVTYGEHCVLENINFNVQAGEFIAIIGKSGSGKTTLLNTLAGFIPYTGKMDIRGKIGFCFQSNSLFGWMTVGENIGFGLGALKGYEKKAAVKEILKKIDMADHYYKYPAELSGGQVQRVALGRAIASDPGILLLDEPFSSLDIYTRDHMIDWVSTLISNTGKTIIMVTHYLDEALVLADRVWVLKERRMQVQVPVPFGQPRTQQIRFTEEFQRQKQKLTDLLNHQ